MKTVAIYLSFTILLGAWHINNRLLELIEVFETQNHIMRDVFEFEKTLFPSEKSNDNK